MDQISACYKKTCSGVLIYRIALNWGMHYNTCHRNWRSVTTTYRILVPRYKSVADIKDFKQRTPARHELVCSCDQKLAYQYT
jgi:hypothetical protein